MPELFGRTLNDEWKTQFLVCQKVISQLNVGRKTDVLVSTTIDYDIDDVEARDNLIRVLLLTDDNFNKNKCLNYDIVISDKPNDMPNLYPIDNLDDLGENLISILNSHYLIKK